MFDRKDARLLGIGAVLLLGGTGVVLSVAAVAGMAWRLFQIAAG